MNNYRGRILSLDYGRRRIGVAISDLLGITAQPLETWTGLSGEEVLGKLKQTIQEKDVTSILLGMPFHLDGGKGELALEVEQFKDFIKTSIDIEIVLWDERLTSKQAERTIQTMGYKPSRKKSRIDMLASVILLQSYLDYLKFQQPTFNGAAT